MSNDEYYDPEAEQIAMEDAYYNTRTAMSMADMLISDNEDTYLSLHDKINAGETLSLAFIIKEKLPCYEFEVNGKKKHLYLNNGIIQHVLKWLMNGDKSPSRMNIMEVDKDVDETYTLYQIKRDRQNNAARYNSTTDEFKAIYSNGTINYGKLPYTKDELAAKLDSLP